MHYTIIFCSSDEPELSVSNLYSLPDPRGGKYIKIIERASVKFQEIGAELLDDKHGNKVANIKSKTNGNVDAMHEIFCQWLREDTQCSWETLVQCLRKCGCKSLADEIDRTLRIRNTQKGVSFALAIVIVNSWYSEY